jgi:hypothetical protein
MKLVNKALNKIRLLLELKGLKNRCLLLKNGTNLTESEGWLERSLVDGWNELPQFSLFTRLG